MSDSGYRSPVVDDPGVYCRVSEESATEGSYARLAILIVFCLKVCLTVCCEQDDVQLMIIVGLGAINEGAVQADVFHHGTNRM